MKKEQIIIFGIGGYSLTSDEINLFKNNIQKIAGFILFSRNVKSRKQIIELTKSLKSLSPNIKIFVDQEGGRVARIKPPIIKTLHPSAEKLSLEYQVDKTSTKQRIYDNYFSLMSDLKALGIDSPCAPMCDIRYDGASNVIGDRSFGDNANQVIDLCNSAINGVLSAEGIPFIKHIPGHGRALLDSHLDLPVVDASLEDLKESDFKVFKELSNKQVWGMTAHIVYNAIDPTLSATISRKVISYIRNEIGFDGILVSDDICMHALHGQIAHDNLKESKQEFIKSLCRVTTNALSAGCDIVLHCSGEIEEMSAICDVV
ncbi:glycoside hydrolase family 3 N-terminal domain-containing protein [Rickettsiaceae bacterium]|nr:glycoside hydrolase family 3 N-terminal domain-containing protein [Rickettsiaceae bacterium]